ncbi:hypothetical protein VTO42DRAFT_1303 [Malbranchea cinnamomea]
MAAQDTPNSFLQPSDVPNTTESRHDDRLSRSPYPYYRRGLNCSGTSTENEDTSTDHLSSLWRITPKPSSDSGTEADDEGSGLLKGVSAPHASPHFRRQEHDGHNEATPALGKARPKPRRKVPSEGPDAHTKGAENSAFVRKKKKLEVLRRVLETAMVLSLGAAVLSREDARVAARSWDKELITFCVLIIILYVLFPLRMYPPGFHLPSWVHAASFPFSPQFDPAPLIYPIILPILISLSLGGQLSHTVLPNIILSLSSLPFRVIPLYNTHHGFSISHWAVTTIPLFISESPFPHDDDVRPLFLLGLNREVLTLLFPLQQAVLSILHFLTTTSLLPSEVQLLATGLINVFLFSTSPQAEILKALLWVGGTLVLLTCMYPCRWEVALARVPSWKFRRSRSDSGRPVDLLRSLDRQLCEKLSSGMTGMIEQTPSDSDDFPQGSPTARFRRDRLPTSEDRHGPLNHKESRQRTSLKNQNTSLKGFRVYEQDVDSPALRSTPAKSTIPKTTLRGRRKRVMGPDLRHFMSLTVAQAKVRKWAYALWVYAAVVLIIVGPVRAYVGAFALRGNEPFGWAVGYLFGNIPSLRFWIVKNNIDRWACLPLLRNGSSCHLGWMEHLRRDTFGQANSRLIISAYYIPILILGLVLVVKLSPFVAVDTRRKVFHGMITMMLLPTVYIDPAFIALALALMLAIFLLLDLFRASQLPPISKPLTQFLLPYVDSRDHRGPVIVSHIFLLLGCATPLWLSLAGLPRAGSPPWEGWEVLGRNVSMVSGVVCVGLGDAAASLVGRRYGWRKWFWGGGKSIEGSLAFTVAVMVGLLVAKTWLVIGGWDAEIPISTMVSSGSLRDAALLRSWCATLGKAALAAAGSSFTEAVVTGGNDNVVVPLVLWLLVRGLDL